MYKSSNNQVKIKQKEAKSNRDYSLIVYNSDIYNSYDFSDHTGHSFRPSGFLSLSRYNIRPFFSPSHHPKSL